MRVLDGGRADGEVGEGGLGLAVAVRSARPTKHHALETGALGTTLLLGVVHELLEADALVWPCERGGPERDVPESKARTSGNMRPSAGMPAEAPLKAAMVLLRCEVGPKSRRREIRETETLGEIADGYGRGCACTRL